MKRLIYLFLMLALLVVGTGMAQEKEEVRVGAKSFTEQLIVGQMMKQLLEYHGYKVDYRPGMGSKALWDALKVGALDVYMEYTGTAWMLHLGYIYAGETAEELESKVRAESAAELNLIWLKCLPINNTYALAVWKDWAEANNVWTVSDLAKHVKEKEGKVGIAVTYEFYARPDGLIGLQKHYGFAFHPDYVKAVAPGMTFAFLIERKVEVTIVFGTDPIVLKYGWVLLEDDKRFFPIYDLCPVIRGEMLLKSPELAPLLNSIIDAFPKDRAECRTTMTALNAKVDIDKKDPEDVAREFLIERSLIPK